MKLNFILILLLLPLSNAQAINCRGLLTHLGQVLRLSTVKSDTKALQELIERPTDGHSIIELLSKDSEILALFIADAGVGEGYSIQEHTKMVYATYNEQYQHFDLSSLKVPGDFDLERLFRFIISVHDIGKPLAIANGSKLDQHKYTTPMVEKLMRKYALFSEEEILVTKVLIDNDILGQYLQEETTATFALEELKLGALKSQMSLEHYFKLQTFFFTIDAASYPKLREGVFREVDGQLVPRSLRYPLLQNLVLESSKESL